MTQEDSVDPRQVMVESALIIAKALQDGAEPEEAIQILAVCTGMVLSASSLKRDNINSVLHAFNKQVNLWCDFEEENKTASWLSKPN